MPNSSTATLETPKKTHRPSLTIYRSNGDKFGNVYWAFGYCDENQATTEATIDGGEGNVRGILRHLGLEAKDVTVFDRPMPIRAFNRLVKNWPHTFSGPEVVDFIKKHARPIES